MSKVNKVMSLKDLRQAELMANDLRLGHYGMREATDLIRRLVISNRELLDMGIKQAKTILELGGK